MNTEELVRDVDGDLFVGSSRVLLENIVVAHQRGQSPEEIHDNYPSLPVEQICGALAYYKEHQQAVDARWAENARELSALHAKNVAANQAFFDAMHDRVGAARSKRVSEAATGEARRA
jgi:uncharacterized protein (DUF433 family)